MIMGSSYFARIPYQQLQVNKTRNQKWHRENQDQDRQGIIGRRERDPSSYAKSSGIKCAAVPAEALREGWSYEGSQESLQLDFCRKHSHVLFCQNTMQKTCSWYCFFEF